MGDQSLQHSLVFVRAALVGSVGRELGKIGTHYDERVVAIADGGYGYGGYGYGGYGYGGYGYDCCCPPPCCGYSRSSYYGGYGYGGYYGGYGYGGYAPYRSYWGY